MSLTQNSSVPSEESISTQEESNIPLERSAIRGDERTTIPNSVIIQIEPDLPNTVMIIPSEESISTQEESNIPLERSAIRDPSVETPVNIVVDQNSASVSDTVLKEQNGTTTDSVMESDSTQMESSSNTRDKDVPCKTPIPQSSQEGSENSVFNNIIDGRNSEELIKRLYTPMVKSCSNNVYCDEDLERCKARSAMRDMIVGDFVKLSNYIMILVSQEFQKYLISRMSELSESFIIKELKLHGPNDIVIMETIFLTKSTRFSDLPRIPSGFVILLWPFSYEISETGRHMVLFVAYGHGRSYLLDCEEYHEVYSPCGEKFGSFLRDFISLHSIYYSFESASCPKQIKDQYLCTDYTSHFMVEIIKRKTHMGLPYPNIELIRSIYGDIIGSSLMEVRVIPI